LIDLGVNEGIVDKSGAWYSYNKDRIGQGKDNVRQFLKEHPDVAADIEGQLREKLLSKSNVTRHAEAESEIEPEPEDELVEA